MTTTTAPGPVRTAVSADRPSQRYRIESIDLLRGAVMIIMAIDHCRDHLLKGNPRPLNMATTTPILFFTRWITHFCAPVFVLLSGVSVSLAAARRTRGQLTSLLITRGLWLVLVEVLLISGGASLDPGLHIIILQVIWVIGVSMLLLGLLIRLRVSRLVIGIIGAIILVGHNVFDHGSLMKGGFIWGLLVSTKGFDFSTVLRLPGHHMVLVIYSLLPWTAVMLLGYAMGPIYSEGFDAARRRRLLYGAGLSFTAAFIILRAFNLYGDPAPWSVQKNEMYTFMSFLNVTKYPSSLLYSLMTLGPALIALAMAERVRNRFTAAIVAYGNVPFFYYVIHWYVIGAITISLFYLQGFHSSQAAMPGAIFHFDPPGFGLSLAGVYVVWMIVIAVMYRPVQWFSSYKRRNRKWWLSYV
ncbi:MAG TPA: heparan-alpha-glucosaminide N-acetyltransferase domain-containing protein [Puia sp.]|nr:heparan-alpha-glucosaminide N-acetyltransferase domain-containing protein [Puia sp.]